MFASFSHFYKQFIFKFFFLVICYVLFFLFNLLGGAFLVKNFKKQLINQPLPLSHLTAFLTEKYRLL
ncbi:unnamed protein product [Meloidogyne enterolobii]|uniref:Uncharacterized protein n=1 Tax=Meloidogyne enterolobii TaxID=390850 RepID=A0ACB1ABG0_MELEN